MLVAAWKNLETSLALHDGALKITQRGVVWNATFQHAKYAKQNLTFLNRRLTFVNHAYFRHANAVQNDLAAQNIAAPTKI